MTHAKGGVVSQPARARRAALIVVLFGSLMVTGATQSVAAEPDFIATYDVVGDVGRLALGPDGNVWFTVGTDGIGRVTTAGDITQFTTPTASSGVAWIAAGPDGNVWFTEQTANMIGRITPTGVITEYPIPRPSAQPGPITTGPDGNLWFTEQGAGMIGRITPAGVITEFPIPTPSNDLRGIAAGPDGNVWFSEVRAQGSEAKGLIARLTPEGVVTEFDVPGYPSGITTGPDGNLWYPSLESVIRMTTAGDTKAFRGFGTDLLLAQLDQITTGPDGNIWFTSGFDVGINRVTPSGSVSAFALGGKLDRTTGVAPGSDGRVWFSSGGKLAALVPPPLCRATHTTPGLRVSPDSGPPTTVTEVSGAHSFGRFDVSFDGELLVLKRGDARGRYCEALTIPRDAQPGRHVFKAEWVPGGGSICTGECVREDRASFFVRTNWPQTQFDAAHSGVNPFENVLGVTNVAELGVEWKKAVSVGTIDSIVVAGNRVFVDAGGDQVYAFTRSGKALWHKGVGGGGKLAAAGGLLYVGSVDGRLYALDPATGKVEWTRAAGVSTHDGTGSPTVWKGKVYVGSGDGTLRAFDAVSGKALWGFTTSEEPITSPAIANGVAYAGSFDGTFYAVDADTGEQLWTYHPGPGAHVSASPAISDRIVYFYATTTWAMNAETGTLVWNKDCGGGDTTPAVEDGIVYGIAGDNVVACKAADGAEVWRTNLAGFLTASPSLANGLVYIGARDHHMYVLRSDTGLELFDFDAGDTIFSSPVITDGRVYVSGFGTLFKLGP